MKFGLLAIGILLVVVQSTQWVNVCAALQGPQVPPNKATSAGKEQTEEDGSNTSRQTESTAESTGSEEGGYEIRSNQRKASKYFDNQIAAKAAQIAENIQGAEADGKNKLLKFAIFERLWIEEVVRKKLQAEIELLEARQEPQQVLDPTPEQIEAESMYENAMEMLSKPNSDKRVAFTLIRKAAEMKHSKARAELAWARVLGHYMDFDFEYAAAEFDDLAKEGLPEANMGLAFLYSVGVGGKNVSQPLALIHLTLAALGDHTYAQMALGYRYSFGINVPASCEKSLSYYKKVAKKVALKVTFASGPLVHRVRLLDELENPGSQETEIVDYYQLLADKGDVQSQVGLGQLYYQGGKAIQQDHQKALEYFTLAANAGNAIGYAFLGKLYLEGSEHIKADNETAFKYFSKAANLGDPVGQSGLGLMYLKGLGVPKDPLKALNYFTMAADQGWVDGQLMLGNMYFTGNGVKTDFKLALKYFNLASQSGHVLAYYNLGFMHAYGIGMLRSCPAAVEFFKNVAERGRWSTNLMHAYADYKNYRINEAYMQYALLAELGYEVAQSNAAFLLDRGDVSIFHDRNEELIRAFYYWKRAASQGYSAAQVKLGDYYYYGWGTNIDFETAAALYRKASEQQYNAQAMFNLGYMHEKGLGMKKDWHLAKRLYDLAAVTNADAKVPVAIALLKLQLLAKIESIKESPYKFIFYLDENIAANWDLYMITILTLLLGFIMYTRRTQEQRQQNQGENNQAAQPENGEAATNHENPPNNENENSATNTAAATSSSTSGSSTDKTSPSSAPASTAAETSSSTTTTSNASTSATTTTTTTKSTLTIPSAVSNSTADPTE
ncbi:protein sel-1 homolog 1 [Stomoxys calcitrans]|uniref:Protein sel-1 homolog 1 n=1 Tax=Stomoxys calcitrans TaxID=35570 RepID=A0A1I8PFF6_STOCA|nr:protein sel-1 homolog 1 [Stomoxys calcitrans]